MNPEVNSRDIEDTINDYHMLLDNFRKLIISEGSKIKIENTKLFKYKKLIDNSQNLHVKELCNLIGLLNKYCSINTLFDTNSVIEISNRDILKLIEGKPVIDDQDENYNDAFFEAEMAIRFAKAFNKNQKQKYKINMCSICDIIIDKKIAIECKYVHGVKRIREKISDGVSQIETRVSEGLASVGIVALDISNLVNQEKILKFSQSLYYEFLEDYKEIMESRSILVKEKKDAEALILDVISNNHFKRIVNDYASHEIERVFYKNFTKHEKEKIDKNAFAVVYQANFYMHFENDEAVVPVPMRTMGYYINETISTSERRKVEHLIHSLAVGI